jgi:hypothetical protein
MAPALRKQIVTRGNTTRNIQCNNSKEDRHVQKEKDREDETITETEEESKSTNGSISGGLGNEEQENSSNGPKDMEIEWGKDKSGDEDDDGKSLSTLTVCPNVAKDGNLTVVQKSNLLNWAEEHFFPGSKIMTFDDR